MSGSTNADPDVLDNVRRVTSIRPEEFFENHVRRARPVIIGDTQADTAIGALTTQEAVAKAFGDVVIQVQRNYTSPLSRNAAEARRQGLSQKVRNRIEEMRLDEYLGHVDADPRTDLLCVEYRTPERIRDALRVPAVCGRPGAAEALEELVSFTFVANRGNYAHLHFDGDFREVLLYQVFGRKRVVMVPLAAQEKISPSMNFSKVLLQNMAPAEKLDLLRYLGAYDCIISPGEAVYFPASIWHYVEYLDTGMSVNFRFGRDDFVRKVVDANRVPFYPELHQLLSLLKDAPERTALEDQIWAEVSTTLAAEHADSRARHRATQDMYRRLVGDLLPAGEMPRQVTTDCPVAEQMAIERHDAPSRLWREELGLGDPI